MPDIDTYPSRATLASQDARLPSALDEHEQRVLASVAVSRAVLPGQELFQRGDSAQSMYLIDTGEVRLSFEDGMADKLLGRGQYFGELSVFIGHHQRFARAVVETAGVFYEITQENFNTLIDREPAVVARFMQRSFSYLVAGEHQLVQSLRRRNEDLMQTLDTLRQTRSELSVAQQLVRSDDLTGLSNRRGLYRYLDEISRYPLGAQKLALLLIDIDHFKRINDLTGHLAGDSALRAVAEEVRRQAGPMDLPCRLGGDEFALVMRVSDGGELANRALGLIAAVRGLRLPSLGEHRLSVSVGGAFCHDPGGWSTWYSRADSSLYEAKRKGGDHWRLAP
ncbi:MAG TPA: GGDEF domain-containing protein [Arenimonas sp.]|uniref:GGDEF domain-containing protein n=1 Tax=Arenimonas sp. TaxID=1872635 RepID=UPI002BBA09A3|nr:GGDEF domain-containing protein [Arenimonas sp.]HMB57781.1 GGDEF domain-containing protein [Arenimonas sp.]